MANIFYALFGSTKRDTSPSPSTDDTDVVKSSSASDLAAKHDAMLSASAAKRAMPVPQKSLKRKHSATVDLYSKVVQIEVGNNEDDNSSIKIFEIHGGLLCKHSGHFRDELGDDAEQDERRLLKFPDHEPEIFRYVTLWMYENKLYRTNQTALEDDNLSPVKTVKPSVELSKPTIAEKGSDLWSDRDFVSDGDEEPPQKKLKQNTCFGITNLATDGSEIPSERGSADNQYSTHHDDMQDLFDSDLTLVGDELSTPIVLSDDEDADFAPPSTQYYDVIDTAQKSHSPSVPMADATIADSPQPVNETQPETVTTSPSPAIPLDTLTLTKLYILAEDLEMPALCNHVIALASQRLPYDEKVLIKALIYAFERSKRDSCICRVLIDYTARYACINEVLGNVEAGDLSKELLVDLLSELGELRGTVADWDEAGVTGMYKLPVTRA